MSCRIHLILHGPHHANYRRNIYSSLAEDIYEMPNELLETLVKQSLQTQQVREKLHIQLGALGQKYVNMLFGGDRENVINHVYGVYLSENGTMQILRCRHE